MGRLNELLENNKKWAEGVTSNQPDFFKNLSTGQSPRYLWIGCADSRVPATQACGLNSGDMFVHRNIANMIVHTDMSSMSVIQYAVQVLKVQDVIICGHYGCGGVAAAMTNNSLGLIDGWLRNIKDVYHKNQDEVDALEDGSAEKTNRLVELNVKQQVLNFCHTSLVQESWKAGQDVTVHGLVYDLKSGQLNDLDCSINSTDQLDKVYRYS